MDTTHSTKRPAGGQLTAWVDEETKEAFQRIADREHRTISMQLGLLISRFLAEEHKEAEATV